MSNSNMSDIDLFFQDPSTPSRSSGVHGVLYLLRRDIKTCLGINPDTGDDIECKAIWPAAMAILAGIDLLGKFLKGNERRGEVGLRFRDFVKKYFKPISSGDAETIYQLRNALMHSFGLRSETRRGKVYKFILTANKEPLVSAQ